MNKKDLRKATPPMPRHFIKTMEETLERIENMNNENMRKHNRKTAGVLLIAAVILVLLAGTGIAVGNRFGIFDFMNREVSPMIPLEGAESVIEKDIAQEGATSGVVLIEETAYSGANYSIVVRGIPNEDEGCGFPELNIKNAEYKELSLSDYYNEDGSVSFQMTGYVDDAPETLDCEISMFCGSEYITVPFQITHREGTKAKLIPQGSGARWSIVSASLSCGKLTATLDVSYRYEALPEESMGVDLRLMLNPDGKELDGGGGSTDIIRQEDGTVIYHSVSEVQSLSELPEKIWIRPKIIGEAAYLEAVECMVVME